MSEYEFKGVHYIASFKECEPINNKDLVLLFEDAIQKSGATILKYNDYVFENCGITFVFLLSESHCSVHTYPEYNSFFIDLFTCGDKINQELFHDTIVDGLKPREISKNIITRT